MILEQKAILRLSELFEAVKDWNSWSRQRQQTYLLKHPNSNLKPTGSVGADDKKPEPEKKAKVSEPSEPSEPKSTEPEKAKSVPDEKKKKSKQFKTKEEFKSEHVDHVHELKPLGGGVNSTFVAVASNGTKSVFKSGPASKRSFKRSHDAVSMMHEMTLKGVVPNFVVDNLPKPISATSKTGAVEKHTHGAFLEFVPGESLGRAGNLDTKVTTDAVNKIKPESIIKAAVADLLINNGDRNLGNVMVAEDGQLSLIDHDIAMSDRKREVKSVFIPGTKYGNRLKGTPFERLHYTKHVKDGKLGTDYPEQTRKTLERIAKSSVEELSKTMKVEPESVKSLIERANDMLNDGFEAAVKKWAKME